ncbi:hypothetical protein [Mesotoga sp. UBA5847]|jgi:hypothetical protein|uniref:hypothetical protein n=1 Tax=Mesotoga sp. UBA5847 TaxID=1946859 RepID=UPI0025F94349|nr:hypothetical protein [Mesotoga sp. UBA5847]
MLGLKIVVERGSGVPLFKQLIDQLRTAIIRGRFLGHKTSFRARAFDVAQPEQERCCESI